MSCKPKCRFLAGEIYRLMKLERRQLQAMRFGLLMGPKVPIARNLIYGLTSSPCHWDHVVPNFVLEARLLQPRLGLQVLSYPHQAGPFTPDYQRLLAGQSRCCQAGNGLAIRLDRALVSLVGSSLPRFLVR